MKSVVENIQEVFKNEADKLAAANSDGAAGEKADVKNPPTDKKEQDTKKEPEKKDPEKKPVETASNGVVEKTIAQQLKEKHGLEYSDEEILDILKKPKSNGEAKADSVQTAHVAPRFEDVTEDEVSTILEKSGKPKELLKQAKELKSKSDTDVVKQHYVDSLTKEHGLTKEDAEGLFAERFFIPPEGQDQMYSAEEMKVGQALLKKEAEQLRGQLDYVIDGVRTAAYNEKVAAYNTNTFQSSVENFMAKADKKFAIPIGKSGAKDLGEFPFEVNDEVSARVAKTMKNPASFADRFKNDEGVFDLNRFYNFLVHLESQENIYKSMANFYHSKGLDEVENKLNNNPDLTNVGKETADKRNKSAAEQKKEAEEYNKDQVTKNLDRNRRSNTR